MKTIKLIDQIRASNALHESAISDMENMDDTVDRVLSIASAGTVDRVLRVLDMVVPVVEGLDALVMQAAEAGDLSMSSWHCGTTHCRAGWAIVYGGDAGAALEAAVGSEMAGRMIYEASTGRIAPDFYASTEDAIADIRRCAELGGAA